MQHRLYVKIVGLVCLLVCLLAPTGWTDSWGRVKWVADGDTIVLVDGRHVRYIGIDAPEIDHDNQRAQPMGYRARELNGKLVEGQPIRLVVEDQSRDRYGRTLAHLYLPDGTWVNGELVRQGYAHVYHHPANAARHEALVTLQREAMEQGRGVWALISPEERPAHAYVGNRRSLRFHTHECPNGRRMARSNRTRLKNQWAAFWQGFAPARGCIVFPPQD